MRDYPALLEFCITDRQREVVQAIIKHQNNLTHASTSVNMTRQGIQSALRTILANAQKRGDLGLHKTQGTVPAGFYAETSVKRRLNPETGIMEVVEDWTKSRLDKANREAAYRQFIEGLTSDIPTVKPVKFKTKNLNPHLASAIIFGDAHIGMLAHAIETLDEDRSLDSSTADLRAAIDYCVDCAVPSEEGWFVNLGDFLHVSSSNNTTHNGTRQDTSANHNQVMRAAATVIRYCIDRMLTKFARVTVINARGNHDEDAAFALNMVIEAVYEKEPRVTVQGNDARFNFIEFGKCLIGVNHGDQINANRLCGVMTRNQAEAWGRTTFRRWWLGHIHHKVMQEHDSGVTLESFHTLAPIDKWHATSGYGAESRVTMLTLHKEFGEVNRMSPSLEMVRAHAA